jgi:hypothetical protein
MSRKQIFANPNIIFFLTFLVWVGMVCMPEEVFGQSQTFTNSGTFTVPHKITSVQVNLWGGGGGGGFTGNNRGAGGGGGGAYLVNNSFSVSLGTISVTVGSGGSGQTTIITPGGTGGNSIFSTLVANGGVGGNGLTGGAGGAASTGGTVGGSASNASGNPNSAGTSGGGGAGGGGAGGAGGPSSGGDGSIGTQPGGGGGGEGRSGNSGGSGGAGQVIVSWTCSNTLTSSAGSNNQTVCLGTGIGNITYVLAGASGATITGLPAGVTGTYNLGDISISGTPAVSGTFNYTITPTGSCTSSTASGTITINAPPTISAQSTATQTQCIGNAFSPISVTAA